jgi:hypothetical protein
MSGEARRLEEQLRRALEGEAWHGPSVLESVAGVSAEQPPRIQYRVRTVFGSLSCISAATTFSSFGDWPGMGDNFRGRRIGLPVPSLLMGTGDRRCRRLPNSTKNSDTRCAASRRIVWTSLSFLNLPTLRTHGSSELRSTIYTMLARSRC